MRGVVAAPARVLVTSRLHAGPRRRPARASPPRGARRIAVEDPSDPEAESERRAGRARAPSACPSTTQGIRVDALAAPAPTRSSSPPRTSTRPASCSRASGARSSLAWLRERGAVAIEDDYDAEYRYDRAAVGALQGLDPEHVVYAGSASKTLAPALRLGWLVAPARARSTPVAHQKLLADRGTARIEQHALRRLPRAAGSSTATCGACASATARGATRSSPRWPRSCPRRAVRGIAAGLHATVELPRSDDEAAILARGGAAAARADDAGRLRLGDATGPADAAARLRAAQRAGDPGRRPRARRGGPRRPAAA